MNRKKTTSSKVTFCVRGVISPVLANIYLHYALDLWFEKTVKPKMKGRAMLIRYADDFVVAFQFKQDAERFYKVLPKRLNKFVVKWGQTRINLSESHKSTHQKNINSSLTPISPQFHPNFLNFF